MSLLHARRPLVVLWQVVGDFIPGRLRTRKLVISTRTVYVPIDGAHRDVKHVGFGLEVDQQS